MAATLASTLAAQLDELQRVSTDDLLAARYEKFRAMGSFAAE